ncbi:hypothetical protein GOP47_0000521 [Adiantum capillus-veneris]|uniref:G domain-containing protein n=1 Tax=Adiantum capillus-veneris TaxID=13818 RepID=A0A9D4ZSZ6_ADICA|nr:hypothetical protein GOP47_0000521 [Adiantum capillus-veneris]
MRRPSEIHKMSLLVERQLSIKDLLCIQYCVQCKKKGRGESEASDEKAVKHHLEADRRKISEQGPVRVLVVGRSGSGKTTLIRLLVGNEGPQSISEGVAGVQDINKEFVYLFEEQGTTFIIHDSNGMDVKGKERVNEILGFLDKHQQCDDFRECIHIIWYVISAIDPRFVDDGDVMKLLSNYEIPLLLIMTHKDYDKVKVTEASLNRLLQAYGDKEEREAMKRLMVKVSNEGVCMGSNNELVIDDMKQDKEGLRLVALRTKILVDRMLMQSTKQACAVRQEYQRDQIMQESLNLRFFSVQKFKGIFLRNWGFAQIYALYGNQ